MTKKLPWFKTFTLDESVLCRELRTVERVGIYYHLKLATTDSRCKVRGYLDDPSGKPLDLQLFADEIGADVEAVESVIRVLVSKGIWAQARNKVFYDVSINNQMMQKEYDAGRQAEHRKNKKNKGAKKPASKSNEINENVTPVSQDVTVMSQTDTDTDTDTPQPPKGDEARELFDLWNEHRGEMTEASSLTGKRAKMLRARLGSSVLRKLGGRGYKTPADYVPLIQHLASSPHHIGQNDRKWRANIEFLFRNDDQIIRFHEAIAAATTQRPQTLTKEQALSRPEFQL